MHHLRPPHHRPVDVARLWVPPLRRAPGCLAVLGLLVAVVLGGSAAPASAHAVVVASSPGDRERLTTAPPDVSITFSEHVTASGPGLEVVDSSGTKVDRGDGRVLSDGTTLATTLQAGLGDGSYFAKYRVISADGHAVSGAVVFAVGSGPLATATPSAGGDDRLFGNLQTATRFLTYLGGLLAAGLAVFVAFVHDGGEDRRRLAAWLRGAALIAVAGAVGTVLTQASLATGGGFGAMVDAGALRDVLVNGLGWATVVLLVGLAAVHLSVDVQPGPVSQALGFYGSVAVVISFALWGHATQAPQAWLAVAADIAHVAAAAVWFGGLVALAIVLRGRYRAIDPAANTEGTSGGTSAPATDPGGGASPILVATAGAEDTAAAATGRATTVEAEDRGAAVGDPGGSVGAGPGSVAATAGVVGRFSDVAAGALVVLAAAGVALAWQEVGSLAGLVSSSYGRVLLLKVALAGVIVAFAAWNRVALVPRVRSAVDDPAVGPRAALATLFRSVRTEGVLLVAVLFVTAALVNLTPGRTADASATSGPFNQTQPVPGSAQQVNLVVSPNQPGPNTVHLTFLDADGRPVDTVQKAELQLSLPDKGIGPITRPLTKAGPGHYILDGSPDLTAPGEWEITVVARLSAFDEGRVTFKDMVTAPAG